MFRNHSGVVILLTTPESGGSMFGQVDRSAMPARAGLRPVRGDLPT
jgi:hypothetical protein